MKKITIIAASIMLATSAMAQDYKAVLAKTFNEFDTATVVETRIAQANRLGLIAKKFPTEWTSHYYVAFSKTLLSYSEKDATKRDAYLDEADKELADAVSTLKKDNDETYVLAALIANARMAVDGSTRWMKYGPIFSNNLDKAKEINADNPRIYYLQGISKLYTPKAFGGGKKVALPYFEKAEGLFAKESHDDITKPNWGMTHNKGYIETCKKDDDQ